MMPSSSGAATLTEEHRIALPSGETSHLQEEYAPGTVLGNYFYLKNKASGVEPGFLAVFIDDAFCQTLLDHILLPPVLPDLRTRLNNVTLEERKGVLKDWLRLHPKEAKQLASLCEENRNVTRYLIKQDYTDPDSKGLVTIPVSRAANSNTVKKWTPGILGGRIRMAVAERYSHFRRRPPSEENRNALLECIGNEIASKAHGMQCQEQTVLFGTYPSGRLKILTRGKWDFGIEPLGEVHGGDRVSGNYLSIGADSATKPSHLSDDSVRDLGEYFALMLTQGDVDAVGSKAQNKFKKGGRLFRLDFGQVYRRGNTSIAGLNDDFSFQKSRHGLKNFSIFEDSSLREKMKGIHYIRKLLTGESPSEETLREYGDEFRAKINSIEVGSDIAIFNDYINKLRVLSGTTSNQALKEEYNELIRELEKTRDNALNTNREILRVFENRISLTPTQLDILEAFEKLTSQTSLTSPDGTVLLNHMRTTKRVACEMRTEGEECILTLGTPRDAREVQKKLDQYLVAHPEARSSIKIGEDGRSVRFNKANTAAVAAVFNEANIQKYKHPREVQLKTELKTKLEHLHVAVKGLNELVPPPKWRLQDGKIILPVRAIADREGFIQQLRELGVIVTAKKISGEPCFVVKNNPELLLPLITSAVDTARRTGIKAQGARQAPTPPPSRTTETPTPPPSIIELSIKSSRLLSFLDKKPLQRLQESFSGSNAPENVVLLRPERLFSRSSRTNPNAITISIRNYSITISSYDKEAVRVGMQMLCDTFKTNPTDIQIKGLTENQIKEVAEIRRKMEPNIAPIPPPPRLE